MRENSPLRKDPYALAHRYWDFMAENPRRHLEYCNPYYMKLLANEREPDANAMDDRSRAIRYAKEHHECFYEIRDISRIISWLPAEESDSD
jgi:hypothetical protein